MSTMTEQPAVILSPRERLMALHGGAGSWPDVAEHVPTLSYRRLDYWTRTGRVKCVTDAQPGSGHARIWNPADYPALARMVALVDAGVWDLDVARALAFRDTSELVPGVWVTFGREWL